jgi:dienelactone hydrolase
MITNSNGFYEYLPSSYATGTATYPLIISLHGLGQLGNGTSTLDEIYNEGLPKLIHAGNFPNSFTVGGQTFQFIVIAPQFIEWPVALDIEGVIDYVVDRYRVNQNRIYLTGLSMGGGVTWDYAGASSAYASKLAAIVPIAGGLAPDHEKARRIAAANLPVYATHNDGDPTIHSWYTTNWIEMINEAPSPIPPARMRIFSSNEHDSWTITYDPNWREDGGRNIYEWMLQYQRTAGAPLPVTLIDYTASLLSSGKVSILWTTSFEENNHHFTIERSTDGNNFYKIGEVVARNQSTGSSYSFEDPLPSSPVSYYRLSQTDIDGKTTYFEVKQINSTAQQSGILRLYPNPVVNDMNIELRNEWKGKLHIVVSTSTGKRVKYIEATKVAELLRHQLPLSDLAPGFYTIQLRMDNETTSASFIKK